MMTKYFSDLCGELFITGKTNSVENSPEWLKRALSDQTSPGGCNTGARLLQQVPRAELSTSLDLAGIMLYQEHLSDQQALTSQSATDYQL